MAFWRARSFAMIALLGGCMNMQHGLGMDSDVELIDVEPSAGVFDTSVADDLDPDENVVEVNLEAMASSVEVVSGHRVSMWTYNGLLPGPRIEAKVGDHLRVRLKNSLPEPTTIHWHGLRVPAAMDGAPMVQTPIQPGDTFTYDFVVEDPGTFWYHPHVRSDAQVERGLYGAIVVHGDEEPEVDGDHVVVLDDLLLDDDWSIADGVEMMEAMNGRQGNLLLVNGHANPVLEVSTGGVQRFRFINAANARFFRMALPGHALLQIGADGALFEAPIPVDDLLVVPGQRVDVLAVPDGAKGALVAWRTLPYERGHHVTGGPAHDVFQLRMATAQESPHSLPAALANVEELPTPAVRRRLKLEETMMSGEHHGSGGHGVQFSINGEEYPHVTPLAATLGDVEEWTIENTSPMDHPFHLHGFRFQVVQGAGVEPTRRAWRDTIDVPAQATVKIRMRFEANPGAWMFHCHILEHAERGMAGELDVAAE